MERQAMQALLAWSKQSKRKPLVIRGARQVGKTWLAKEFGRRYYENIVYLNFDMNANPQSGSLLHSIFEGSLEPRQIISAIEIALETKIDPERSLLIFDEVQEQPRVLNSLKYFFELAPEYSIVAAGSHLGVSMHKDVSFPVGSVSFVYLCPLSFQEFLIASGRSMLAELIT